jgi:hypothetical protein
VVFTIGIDPHKGSHLAAVLDEHEMLLEELRVRADRYQRDQLLKFAAPYVPRVWAIEGARGLGALLAQQLVAAGETVVDVPAKLSARLRTLDNERSDKDDSHDARSAAIVGMYNPRLLHVAPEDHVMVLRMLAKRHHDLQGRRTQSICRLHAVLVTMVPGGLPKLFPPIGPAKSFAASDPQTASGSLVVELPASSSRKCATPTGSCANSTLASSRPCAPRTRRSPTCTGSDPSSPRT